MKIFNKLSLFIGGLLIGGTLMFAGTTAQVQAIDVLTQSCNGSASNSAVCAAKSDNAESTMKKVINMLLFIIGIVAVISIIIGGIMYTVSSGDQGKIKTAKDTILYAVVGLVVAILAFAIVNFVVNNLG